MATSTRQVKGDDYYAIIGVSRSSTFDEIKSAFRQLAKKYHPDLYRENLKRLWACRKMQEINTAYEVLSNPAKREAYDKENPQRHSVIATETGAATKDTFTHTSDKSSPDKKQFERFLGPLILVAWVIGTLIYLVINWSQASSNNVITSLISILGQLIFAGLAVAFFAFIGLFAAFYIGAYVQISRKSSQVFLGFWFFWFSWHFRISSSLTE